MAEEAIQERTMFQILLMAGTAALHNINMIRLQDFLRHSGQLLMCSGLFSLARRLIIHAMLTDQGNVMKKTSYSQTIKPQIGCTRLTAKATETPELKSLPEDCSCEECCHHTIPSCRDSGISIIDLSPLCDCDNCYSLEQDPFAVAFMTDSARRNNFQKGIERSTLDSDSVACKYSESKDLSLEQSTNVTSVFSSSISVLSAENRSVDSAHLSVIETVSTASWVTHNCGLMYEVTDKSMAKKLDSAPPPWGTDCAVDNLLPVSDCAYDAKGRLIRMTVHLQSAEGCSSSTTSDDATEDVFELYWQSDDDDGYLDHDEHFDVNDCPSDDSDVVITFEEQCPEQDSCETVSVFLKVTNCDYSDDVSLKNFDDEKDDISPRKRVSFKSDLEVHPMIAWKFAYQAARKGPWERAAADRARFKQRIKEVETVLAPIIQKRFNKLKTNRASFN